MKKITFSESVQDTICLGDLCYGEILKGVPGNPNSIYIKVNKKELGDGLRLYTNSGHSVLMNLRTASLRQIQGSVLVIPLKSELYLSLPNDPTTFMKGDGRCE